MQSGFDRPFRPRNLEQFRIKLNERVFDGRILLVTFPAFVLTGLVGARRLGVVFDRASRGAQAYVQFGMEMIERVRAL